MASTSETGHAKNVANLKTLISFAEGYGAKYNPTKKSIMVSAAASLQQSADDALQAVNSLLPP